MSDTLLDFRWEVAASYQWLGTQTLGGGELTPYLMEKESKPRRAYCPLREHAALFRTFASIDPTPDGVMEFVREYGVLGRPVSTPVTVAGADVSERAAFGESLEGAGWVNTWRSQIETMRYAIIIHDAIVTSDLQTLNRLSRSSLRSWAWAHSDRREFPSSGDDDPVARAVQYLKFIVHRHLSSTVRAQLLSDEQNPTKLRLVFAPESLIGALWLQLAMAISEHKSYPPCKFCGRPFEIAKGETGFRTNREFCSDKCKSGDYRKRRTAAVQLAVAGASERVIAERTHTDKVTIRKWLRALRGEHVSRKRGK